MYTLYQDGEEIDTYDTVEALKAEIALLRKDYTIDEQYDMNKWPEDFEPGYAAGENFDAYFCDFYQVTMTVNPRDFL